MGKNGDITREELTYYLNHWGFSFTEANLNDLISFLDADGDGKITYADFQHTVGSIISPAEQLYFRQDNSKNQLARCIFPRCWEPANGASDFCLLHDKVNAN